tara:strand:+ start:1059 stop:1460 length:402 start_codon:yes stop_codon:yes gene_type:complete
MRFFILILIIIPNVLISQNDTIYNKNNKIISINEKGIDFLVTKYEKILLNKNGVSGWRLQLKFQTKEADILKLKLKFIKLYPDIPVYIEYKEPYYRIRVGDCRTKLEAIKIKNRINKHFINTYPVPEIINIYK